MKPLVPLPSEQLTQAKQLGSWCAEVLYVFVLETALNVALIYLLFYLVSSAAKGVHRAWRLFWAEKTSQAAQPEELKKRAAEAREDRWS